MEKLSIDYLEKLSYENYELFRTLLWCAKERAGRIKVVLFFNAYQPKANEDCYVEREIQAFPDDKEFERYVAEIKRIKVDREKRDSLLKIAISDCYSPLLALSKLFPNSMTIAFPQITLDGIARVCPQFHEKIFLERSFELGISSYNHAFAPMMDDVDLYDEYILSLKKFKSKIRVVDFVPLHIPECAVSLSLLNVLSKIQSEEGVRFVTVLDSTYHNAGQYDIGRPNELVFFVNGRLSRLRILFANNFFSRKQFSFPPNFGIRDTGYWLFTQFLDCLARPQPYKYLEISENTEVYFVIHTDAETIGFHMPGREYSLFVFLSLLREFGFETCTLSQAARAQPKLTREIQQIIDRTWDMQTHGRTDRWMRRESADLFFRLRAVCRPLIDQLEKEVKREEERQEVALAREHYRRARTSCPHWWDKADSPAGKQFARDVLNICESIQKIGKLSSSTLNEVEKIKQHPFIKKALT